LPSVPQALATPGAGSSHARIFLGATSYSAILSDELDESEAHLVSKFDDGSVPRDESTSKHVEQGVEVLSFLNKSIFVSTVIRCWYSKSESSCLCPEPIMRVWLENLWQCYGVALNAQDTEECRELVLQLLSNTKKKQNLDMNISASEWAMKWTGNDIKWQVIGLIAVVAGFSVVCMDPAHELFVQHKISRADFLKLLVESSKSCIAFVHDCYQLDEICIWHLYEHARLIRVVRGEGSHEAYRAAGERNDALVAMGFHHDIRSRTEVPFFLIELRKRLASWIYIDEVSYAAFLGRPPRLSSRYCNLETPLDLTDKQILLQGSELSAAIAHLDADGYNSIDSPHRTTWLRMQLGFGPIREEIIDLNLGQYTPEETLRRAQLIQQSSKEGWSKLPRSMRKYLEDGTDTSKMEGLKVLYRTMFRQEFHSIELLLQRVLVRKELSGAEKLIRIAQVIFDDILIITQRPDFAVQFRVDFASLLLVYGLRNAAVVAVELLKRERRNIIPDTSLWTRSRTIQNLSVFIDRLGTVEPSSGGYEMCQQGRKAIARILDKILSPLEERIPGLPQKTLPTEIPTEIHSAVSTTTEDHGAIAHPVADFDHNQDFDFENVINTEPDYNFMQWLERTDWDQVDFMTDI
jgi:hypothetical protein